MRFWVGLSDAEERHALDAAAAAIDLWPEERRRAALRWLLGMVCDERGTHPDDIIEWMREEIAE